MSIQTAEKGQDLGILHAITTASQKLGRDETVDSGVNMDKRGSLVSSGTADVADGSLPTLATSIILGQSSG